MLGLNIGDNFPETFHDKVVKVDIFMNIEMTLRHKYQPWCENELGIVITKLWTC